MMATTRTRHATLVLLDRPGAERRALVGLDVLAREAGLHPDLVRRLVRLGLVERVGGTTAAPLFSPAAAERLKQAARLRRDLALSYAGAVLASELLTRIDELETRLRRYEPRGNRRR